MSWQYQISGTNQWKYSAVELQVVDTPGVGSGVSLITKGDGLFITTKDGRNIVTTGAVVEVPDVITTKDGVFILTKDGKQITVKR